MAKTEQDTDAVDLSRVRMLWWENVNLQGLARSILADPKGRTELHLGDLLFHAVPSGAAAQTEDGDDGPWNFSHVCPPVCP